MPSHPGAVEELLAPPAAGPTILDKPLVNDGAPVGNALPAPLPDGALVRRREDPPKAPPLTPLIQGTDLYDIDGIICHLVRTSYVPTGDPSRKKGRSRFFATIFDEARITFEMLDEDHATPTSGWGPIVTITATRTSAK